MARRESDREDLFAEATALVRRLEVTGPGLAEPVVVLGFHRDGGLSVYFGGDLVYHFDRAGRLKRAYRDGRLYRTQGETLAELTRERTPSGMVLRRRDLPVAECGEFVAEMVHRMRELSAQMSCCELRIARQVPEEDAALWMDLEATVARIGSGGNVELAPRFKGKR